MITSAQEFIELRTSEEPDLYRRAAEEEATLEVWFELVDNYPEMRSWVAYNKTVPVEVLKRLAHDTDINVRCMVASKRKLIPELFELLARDEDETVRQRIAYNKKVPVEILEQLSNDSIKLVSEAAKKHLKKNGS